LAQADREAVFWVIYDTGTKPDYYADVHKLLALPRGSILRYDYRRKYLDDRAEEAIFGGGYRPDQILLVYAQSSSYVRGNEPPSGQIPADIFFVPTRLARLAMLPTPEAETTYYDIAVEGYPDPDSPAFSRIMDSLVADGAAPYERWVAISNLRDDFEALSNTSGDARWERIVELLATSPAQFAGDVFWRLGPPTRPPESRNAITEDLVREDGETYQVVSRYKLYQGHDAVMPVVSHTPIGTAGGVEQRRVVQVTSQSQKLQVVGSGRIELRRYSQDTARIRAAQSDDASAIVEVISLVTPPSNGGWPSGPTFDLSFQVSKRPWRVAVGVALLVLAAVLASVGGVSESEARIALIGLGVLAGVLAGLTLTGKLAKP
jgi:hypothetical protein